MSTGTLTRTVPTAVIALDFDPFLHIGDGGVRWETVAIAAAIFAAIVVAGAAVRAAGLRIDDLMFVLLGIVPGAVVGGRLGYVFLHPAFFRADPGRILDAGLGSLELTLGVAGGALSGALVALLLDGRPGRWLHVATLPMLVVIAGGKLAMVLAGRGQGQPWDGAWATAYVGSGPWGSLGPEVPSHPAQVYEAVATIAILVTMMVVLTNPRLRRPDGRAFLVALAAWAAVRAVVAATWRDPLVLGPFRAEQALDLVVAGAAVILAVVVVRRGSSDRSAA